MNRNKKWIIASLILLAAGALVCGISYAALGFDFGKLNTIEYVTNTYDVNDDFQNINIKADTEKISLVRSDDGTCRVVCVEQEDDPHLIQVTEDTLTIERKKKNSWHFFNFGIVLKTQEITVYLPGDLYKTLSIDADTGDVNIPEDFTFDSIQVTLDTGDVNCRASASADISVRTDTGHIIISDVTASGMKLSSDTGKMDLTDLDISGSMDIIEGTGKVTMKNVTCKDLVSDGSTGTLILTNVLSDGEFHLERDTGNIEFNGCDAEAVYVKTDTGNVTGTLLSDKVFLADSGTGRIDVPKTIAGGRCEITTDTGDIKISVQ